MKRAPSLPRHAAATVARLSIALSLVLSLVLALGVGAAAAAPKDQLQESGDPPVFAYYYIWFNPTSWDRAKTDYPLLGHYSSDERQIMRQHIRWAKQAGISGFLVSWKSTSDLNRRLSKLLTVARDENFKLGIIYQGLDFAREPLPAETVAHDLELFSNRFARRKPFRFLSKPLVIWSGTWRFTRPEVASVTNGVRDRLLLLASERNARGYHRLADLVDGDAYYWSSVNPDTYPNYEGKLNEMSTAVHRRQGLWIAPVAPGFDARLIGGTTVVPRNNGATMRREYNAAIGSSPDMVGLISWNEFSENSHIEPSRKYDSRGLDVLADIRGAKAPEVQGYDSSEPGRTSVGRGLGMLGVLLVLVAGGMVAIRRQRLPKRW